MRTLGWLVAVCLVMLITIGQGAAPASADHCTEDAVNCFHPEGDDQSDTVVTEGVQFPGVTPGSPLHRATAQNANCTDCQWTLVPTCIGNAPSGGAETLCMGAVMTCPDPADLRYWVYLRHGTGPWEQIDTVCLGPNERPATVRDIGAEVRTRVVTYLPDAHPSFQPRAGGIVNLPTLFAAGEPRTMRSEAFDVLGFRIVITATARWEWTFDDGVVRDFDAPGGAYPDQSVAYTYADPGARQVSVTTYWDAQFTVNGQGPFDVPGPEISKTVGPMPVPVRAAASELVGG